MAVDAIFRPSLTPSLVRYGLQRDGSTDRRPQYWESMKTAGIPLSQVSMVVQYPNTQHCAYLYLNSGSIVGMEFIDQRSTDEFAENLLKRIHALAMLGWSIS